MEVRGDAIVVVMAEIKIWKPGRESGGHCGSGRTRRRNRWWWTLTVTVEEDE